TTFWKRSAGTRNSDSASSVVASSLPSRMMSSNFFSTGRVGLRRSPMFHSVLRCLSSVSRRSSLLITSSGTAPEPPFWMQPPLVWFWLFLPAVNASHCAFTPSALLHFFFTAARASSSDSLCANGILIALASAFHVYVTVPLHTFCSAVGSTTVMMSVVRR